MCNSEVDPAAAVAPERRGFSSVKSAAAKVLEKATRRGNVSFACQETVESPE